MTSRRCLVPGRAEFFTEASSLSSPFVRPPARPIKPSLPWIDNSSFRYLLGVFQSGSRLCRIVETPNTTPDGAGLVTEAKRALL